MARTGRFDRFQREHAWLGFPIAVAYKAFDDRAPYLAGLITYYAFVSLFPLLLLFLSGTGFFLDGQPHLRQQIIRSALKQFPAIGDQLRDNISGFHGSSVALAIGVIGTLYGALGAMQAAQMAFNKMYGVPRNSQPNPIKSRLRSLLLVLLLGTGIIITTGISALVLTWQGVREFGPLVIAGGYLLALLLNILLFTVAFQLLTAQGLHIANVLTGGIVAGTLWQILQIFGGRYVSGEARHASSVYGYFGLVLAAIAWIYLQSLILMISVEINVVLHRHLWPRALLTPFTDRVELTEADRNAYTTYAKAQRFKGFQHISSRFDPPEPDGDRPCERPEGPAVRTGRRSDDDPERS